MVLENKKSYFKIYGGRPLHGEVSVSGAKNSALPLLFASLLSDGVHSFYNVPELKDIQMALKILLSLGLSCKKSKSRLVIENFNLKKFQPCPESARAFRASVLCLGPLLSRVGKAQIPFPGGCDIGSRPIDIHLKGLRQLGAKIFFKKDMIYGVAPKEGLKGCEIKLDFPSVGATENLIMACVLSKGSSRLKNVACEPEIQDLVNYLKSLGAKIEKITSRELEIYGVPFLKNSSQLYTVIPDRIEAGTWLVAGACTKGSIKIKNCRPDHLTSVLEVLERAGFGIDVDGTEISLNQKTDLKAVSIKTGVYPSFPTDLQAQFMALMTQLRGFSSLEETIFENRFLYIEQLNLMGADIEIENKVKASVKGPVLLKGSAMLATDLRAGAGLVLGALAAKGEGRVYGLNHIERGYENFCFKLQGLNANIQLCKEN